MVACTEPASEVKHEVERTLGKLGPDYELHMTEGFAPIASLSDTDPGFDLGV